jgi:hypothetical protein
MMFLIGGMQFAESSSLMLQAAWTRSFFRIYRCLFHETIRLPVFA